MISITIYRDQPLVHDLYSINAMDILIWVIHVHGSVDLVSRQQVWINTEVRHPAQGRTYGLYDIHSTTRLVTGPLQKLLAQLKW